ncbi:MAG TPA: LuxR C-terminal-related transcriptional regulator [Roseiflexaceae bacterium]|nr:LuxR C-terminal-related transcriptional regulator [Roseiflexaceae bacterium]
MAPAQQALSESAYAAAWEAGQAFTLEQAIERALAELAGGVDTATRIHPQAPIPSSHKGDDALTARELEVAALIAQGKSNRAIAQALVVGVKTVEAHTSRILAKLGFSSRAQISAWAVANGLAAAPADLERALEILGRDYRVIGDTTVFNLS